MIDRGFSDAVPVVGVLARGSAMAVKEAAKTRLFSSVHHADTFLLLFSTCFVQTSIRWQSNILVTIYITLSTLHSCPTSLNVMNTDHSPSTSRTHVR